MRLLSPAFGSDLESGLLSGILQRVKEDNTLMLAIRKDYINIYYRGGNIMKISTNGSKYKAFFDTNYKKTNKDLPDLPDKLTTKSEADKWISSLPHLKGIMDVYFSTRQKAEREFQQLIARENNSSSISNETEYFISDMEFSDSDTKARFDMLAIKWLAAARKDGTNCIPAVIEVKYGYKALDGNAGIISHLKDFEQFIADKNKYSNLLNTMASQFNQLDNWGLLNFNRHKNCDGIVIEEGAKPQFIFILANYNPRSDKLKSILNDPEMDRINQSDLFDLRFFVTSFAGYGLHAKNMFKLDDFKNYLKMLNII